MSDRPTDTQQATLTGNVQTRLVNKNTYPGTGVVPIGRSTKFGNQFKMKQHGGEYTREGCVEAFAEWWYADDQADLREQAIRELTGEIIGCYCLGEEGKYTAEEPISEVKGEPSVCHGEVILRFLNEQQNSLPE